MGFLDTVVYGTYTVKHVLILVGVLIVVKVLFGFLFTKKKEDKHSRFVQCSCGWSGKVSKFAGVCPNCGKRFPKMK